MAGHVTSLLGYRQASPVPRFGHSDTFFPILFQNVNSWFYVSNQSSFQISTTKSCFLYSIYFGACSISLSTQLIRTGIYNPTPLVSEPTLHRLQRGGGGAGERYALEKEESTLLHYAAVSLCRHCQGGTGGDPAEHKYTVK